MNRSAWKDESRRSWRRGEGEGDGRRRRKRTNDLVDDLVGELKMILTSFVVTTSCSGAMEMRWVELNGSREWLEEAELRVMV